MARSLTAAGRWHHAGNRVVYLAATPAAAQLEVCVHTCAHDVPPEFTLLRLVGPRGRIRELRERSLPADWRLRVALTRDLGSAWLTAGSTALLAVPSAIVPATVHFVLNPAHAEASRFTVAGTIAFPFDPRLKR